MSEALAALARTLETLGHSVCAGGHSVKRRASPKETMGPATSIC
jgi:hypothetical protein